MCFSIDKGLRVSDFVVRYCRSGFGLLASELSADPVQNVNMIIIINNNINILLNTSLPEDLYEATQLHVLVLQPRTIHIEFICSLNEYERFIEPVAVYSLG